MKRISSKTTSFYKRGFPLIWFGILTAALVMSLVGGAYKNDPMMLAMPLIMAVFGFFLMKKLVWDLADEVHDCGDALLIRNRGVEERVALSNIMNVSATSYTNPPRIALRLVSPGRLGSEVSFSPATPFSLNPFAKNAVAEDLIVRVDQARSARAR